MYTTVVELEFTELPDTPCRVGVEALHGAGAGNGFLLSLWDTSCKIASWNADAQRFEDAGGVLNPAAIRAWAPLPQPLDAPSWGRPIVERALSRNEDQPGAGWLQPIYTGDPAASR